MSDTGYESIERPLPALPEPDTDRFWAATGDRQLTYPRCQSCDRCVFYPRTRCPRCGSDDLVWEVSAGAGTVYSFTVIRRHGHPYFRSRTPYVLAYIDVDEGFRMLAEVDAPPDGVAIGQRVTVTWEAHDSLAIPVFVAQG